MVRGPEKRLSLARVSWPEVWVRLEALPSMMPEMVMPPTAEMRRGFPPARMLEEMVKGPEGFVIVAPAGPEMVRSRASVAGVAAVEGKGAALSLASVMGKGSAPRGCAGSGVGGEVEGRGSG